MAKRFTARVGDRVTFDKANIVPAADEDRVGTVVRIVDDSRKGATFYVIAWDDLGTDTETGHQRADSETAEDMNEWGTNLTLAEHPSYANVPECGPFPPDTCGAETEERHLFEHARHSRECAQRMAFGDPCDCRFVTVRALRVALENLPDDAPVSIYDEGKGWYRHLADISAQGSAEARAEGGVPAIILNMGDEVDAQFDYARESRDQVRVEET